MMALQKSSPRERKSMNVAFVPSHNHHRSISGNRSRDMLPFAIAATGGASVKKQRQNNNTIPTQPSP
jgi:hypothetical protein